MQILTCLLPPQGKGRCVVPSLIFCTENWKCHVNPKCHYYFFIIIITREPEEQQQAGAGIAASHRADGFAFAAHLLLLAREALTHGIAMGEEGGQV